MKRTNLEEKMMQQIKLVKLPTPECEYKFHPGRKWRFDFAWPDSMIAVEVEGGLWSYQRGGKSGHFNSGVALKNCEKYNEAAIMGWAVLRFPVNMIDDGSAIDTLERALKRQ